LRNAAGTPRRNGGSATHPQRAGTTAKACGARSGSRRVMASRSRARHVLSAANIRSAHGRSPTALAIRSLMWNVSFRAAPALTDRASSPPAARWKRPRRSPPPTTPDYERRIGGSRRAAATRPRKPSRRGE
jgi:hypothetical protein